jgi:Zn-dependent protease
LLLTYSSLLSHSVLLFITFFGSVLTALVAGITFHEFSHAVTAAALGDETARSRGRVSLDPRRHLDPAGFLFLFLAGFGWGKPTPVNPYRLRHGPKTGRAIVSAAGPISNLILAGAAGLPIRLGLAPWHSPFLVPFHLTGWTTSDYVGLYLSAFIVFNVILTVFNLLPIAPLDGFSVAVGLLPRDLSASLAQLEQYGPMILMILIVLPFVTQGQVSLLHHVMSPLINALIDLVSGVGGHVIG